MCVYASMCACELCVYVCKYVCVYVCVCVCVYVCVHVFPACESTPDGFVQTVRFLFGQPIGHLFLSKSFPFRFHQTMKGVHAAITAGLTNAIIIVHRRQ